MKSVGNSYALVSSVRDLNGRGIHLRWSFSLLLFDQRGSSAESDTSIHHSRRRLLAIVNTHGAAQQADDADIGQAKLAHLCRNGVLGRVVLERFENIGIRAG